MRKFLLAFIEALGFLGRLITIGSMLILGAIVVAMIYNFNHYIFGGIILLIILGWKTWVNYDR
jgi:hypothetical protein